MDIWRCTDGLTITAIPANTPSQHQVYLLYQCVLSVTNYISLMDTEGEDDVGAECHQSTGVSKTFSCELVSVTRTIKVQNRECQTHFLSS